MDKTEFESKELRFKRVAARRTRAVLRDLRILGNCGNKGNYSYNESDIRKIFGEIDQALRETRLKFHFSKDKDKEFKL